MQPSAFDCGICFGLAVQPQCCKSCGQIFCNKCLMEIFHPHPFECLRCAQNQFSTLEKTPLEEVYIEVFKKSQINIQPNIVAPQKQINKQIEMIIDKPCIHFKFCQSKISVKYEKEQVCGPECMIFTLVESLLDNQNYNSFRHQIKQAELVIKEKNAQNQNYIPQQNQAGQGITKFAFDKGGLNISMKNNTIILKEEEYIFRTVISNTPMNQGLHYWEISIHSFTKNELKIGVSTILNQDLNVAFSDTNTGYAYYTIGQFRNGSNANGFPYGANFKNKGIVGVILDMNKGILGFSYNGIYQGQAIQSKNLQKGPIYPAVALLHHAGFDYKVGIPIPSHILAQLDNNQDK